MANIEIPELKFVEAPVVYEPNPLAVRHTVRSSFLTLVGREPVDEEYETAFGHEEQQTEARRQSQRRGAVLAAKQAIETLQKFIEVNEMTEDEEQGEQL